MDARRRRLAEARLYLVCAIRDDTFLDAALAGGVDVVQLRDKTAGDGELVDAGRRYAARCGARGALFILNDRPELVADAHADGVHVGQDDTAVPDARTTVGAARLVGLSTHTPEEVDAADDALVDYIGVGPVHATPTKPGRPAVGLALVRHAAAHARVPFFAIGGIDAGSVAAVRDAGATRIAAVRAITEAPDARGAARELRASLTGEATVAGA